MALDQHNALLADANGSDPWSRFFPPERFPNGFAAPECFRPGSRPDRRSDLSISNPVDPRRMLAAMILRHGRWT